MKAQNLEISSQNKQISQKLSSLMEKMTLLEDEIAKKDAKNEQLSKQLEKKVVSVAEDYTNKTLNLLLKQEEMRQSFSKSLRKEGETSASRLHRILSKEHPEYREFLRHEEANLLNKSADSIKVLKFPNNHYDKENYSPTSVLKAYCNSQNSTMKSKLRSILN